eukprot:696796-Pleurochrysis_carterae.AAC.2
MLSQELEHIDATDRQTDKDGRTGRRIVGPIRAQRRRETYIRSTKCIRTIDETVARGQGRARKIANGA